MEALSIDAQIRAIIADYKAGKDVTTQLVDIRSGGNYYDFHDWVIERWPFDGFYNYVDIKHIPIDEHESFYDYFEENDLYIKAKDAKIAALGLSRESDNTFDFKIIEGIYLTIQTEFQGKGGAHFHSLALFKSLEEAMKTEREQGALLYDEIAGECVTHTEDELVEIWDNFVLKAKNKRRPVS